MRRLISSSAASRTLSLLLKSHCRINATNDVALGAGRLSNNCSVAPLSWRCLSTSGGDGPSGGNNNDKDVTRDLDPFGVSFDDGDGHGNVGPASQIPPKLKRDPTTGKLTGEVEAELTEEEKEILRMDPMGGSELMARRVIESWKKQADQDGGDTSEILDDIGRRVRQTKMSLNILGRSVKSQTAKTLLDDGEEYGRDGFTQNLSKEEFETFQKFMRDHQKTDVNEDDIPVHHDASESRFSQPNPFDDVDDNIPTHGITDESAEDPDNPDLSLKWLTSRAKYNVDKKYGSQHPFEDVLPRDLNLSRIVNRKRAKIMPVELLSHNNLGLLRRYISPAGQIMHRVRSKLDI
jgi:hypothetical protein